MTTSHIPGATVHVPAGTDTIIVDPLTVIIDPGAPPPPPPPPPPTPGTKIITVSTLPAFLGGFGANIDKMIVAPGTVLAAVGDKPIPIPWAGDRRTQPLTVEFGAGAMLVGSGVTLGDGIIATSPAAQDVTFTGLVLDKADLANCGSLSLHDGARLAFKHFQFGPNLRRVAVPGHTSVAYMTWGVYGWGSPVDCLFEDGIIDGGNKLNMSGFQLDDEAHPTSAPKNITLRRVTLKNSCFALYENLPATGFILEDVQVINSGGRGYSINCNRATGTYHNVTKDAASEPFKWGLMKPV